MSDSDVLLRASGVKKHFGGVRAVDGMDIEVRRGQIAGLIGPNGAGKTTFFHCLSGFIQAGEGTVTFDGTDISGWPIHKTSTRGLVRTFQLESALERMTVLENVMLAEAGQQGERLWGALRRGKIAHAEAELRQRAADVIEFFGLTRLTDEFAGNLSGGQKKLVDLARALMLKPQMMLLDEPMAGVNPTLRGQIMERIEALRDDGMTVLLVEHDMHTVFGHCDHVVVMAEGKKLAEGDAETVRDDPRVREAYLG